MERIVYYLGYELSEAFFRTWHVTVQDCTITEWKDGINCLKGPYWTYEDALKAARKVAKKLHCPDPVNSTTHNQKEGE